MVNPHPAVASWLVTLDVPEITSEWRLLMRLSADRGVVLAAPPPPLSSDQKRQFWTAGLGEWKSTGDRTAQLRVISLGTDDEGTPLGICAATATVAVDEQGLILTGSFRLVMSDYQGNTTWERRGNVRATRIVVDEAGLHDE